MGIEPTYLAWKASVLPLNYTRIKAVASYMDVGVTGFEPATSWSQTRRSDQPEPHPGKTVYATLTVRDKIRTRDLLIRSQTLYPAELHVHTVFCGQHLHYSRLFFNCQMVLCRNRILRLRAQNTQFPVPLLRPRPKAVRPALRIETLVIRLSAHPALRDRLEVAPHDGRQPDHRKEQRPQDHRLNGVAVLMREDMLLICARAPVRKPLEREALSHENEHPEPHGTLPLPACHDSEAETPVPVRPPDDAPPKPQDEAQKVLRQSDGPLKGIIKDGRKNVHNLYSDHSHQFSMIYSSKFFHATLYASESSFLTRFIGPMFP